MSEIRPNLVLTFRNHGFDGECVAGLHDAHGLVLGVVGYVRSTMEQLVNTWKKQKNQIVNSLFVFFSVRQKKDKNEIVK